MSLGSFIQDTATPPALPDSVPTPHVELSMLKSLPIDELLQRLVNGVVTLVINVALAVVVFYAGKFIINKLYNIVHGILLRRRVDSSLASFVLSFVRIVLYFILIITVIGILGIETSSFLAIFASAGVALGMALSGTLQNFAGGVLILLLKPYRVGEYIEAQGYAGTVKEIQIFHTVIVTPDNKSIIIPNGGLSTGSVNNWSREKYRRVDWSIGISYGDDVDTARTAILRIIESDKRIIKSIPNTDNSLKEQTDKDTAPQHQASTLPSNCLPQVVLDSLGESAVNLKARAWARTSDYWTVYHEILERIYTELPDAGVSFPFRQLDVHLTSQSPYPTPDNKKETTI